MPLEPIHEASVCFSYILYATSFALNTINEVVALATDICFGNIRPISAMACDLARFNQFWAVSAQFDIPTFFVFSFWETSGVVRISKVGTCEKVPQVWGPPISYA